MPSGHDSRLKRAQLKIGQASQRLRDFWILTGLILIGGILLGLRSTMPSLLWIPLTSLAAVAVALDRVADWYDKKAAELDEEEARTAVNNALTALLGLLDDTHEILFLKGAAKEAELKTLRSQLAHSASFAPTASNTRASCYLLTHDADGWRELCNPKSRGRADEASTEFCELDDPDHPIWTIMSAKDTDCVIYKAPDPHPRVDWEKKPYKTFISVPIQADGVTLGMLSLNAPHAEDLDEVDRLTVIAMARTMATVLAMDKGPSEMKRLQDESR